MSEARRTVSVRLDPDDQGGIDSLIATFPLATVHAVARAALRAGLRVLQADHEQALDLLRPSRKRPPLRPATRGA